MNDTERSVVSEYMNSLPYNVVGEILQEHQEDLELGSLEFAEKYLFKLSKQAYNQLKKRELKDMPIHWRMLLLYMEDDKGLKKLRRWNEEEAIPKPRKGKKKQR